MEKSRRGPSAAITGILFALSWGVVASGGDAGRNPAVPVAVRVAAITSDKAAWTASPADGSRDGAKILLIESPRTRFTESDLYLVATASGASRPLMQSHSSIGPAAFSPDGNEVFFFEIKDGETAKLIKISLAGTHRSVVAELPEGTEVRGMSWSPDGTKLAFDYTTPPSASGQIKSALSVLENGGVRDVYSYVNDVSSARVASGEPQQIVIPSWLSDKEVVFNALAPIGPPPRYFVMSVNIAGQDGALRQLWELPPYAACAHVSPDGKWLIYHQRMNVFLRSLSDGRIIKVGEGIIGGGSPWLGQLPNPSILVSREVELYERPADAPRGVAYRAPFVITMNWGG